MNSNKSIIAYNFLGNYKENSKGKEKSSNSLNINYNNWWELVCMNYTCLNNDISIFILYIQH